jgi:hypothetical protein
VAKFNEGGRKGNVPVVKGGSVGTPTGQFEITNGKCKVCQSPHRREIDNALAMGMSQTAVRNYFNVAYGHEFFTSMNISTHARKHMTLRDAANAAIYEENARRAGLDTDRVAGYIRTQRANLERIVNETMDAMGAGITQPEIKDALAAIQILEKMNEANHDLQIAEIEKQFRTFLDAVKEICPEDMWGTIFETYERNMGTARAVDPAAIEAAAEEIIEEED